MVVVVCAQSRAVMRWHEPRCGFQDLDGLDARVFVVVPTVATSSDRGRLIVVLLLLLLLLLPLLVV